MTVAVALLDVNVLLALAWPNHLHHDAAHEWFAAQRAGGWASCTLTQSAFVRLSCQPSVVKTVITIQDAMQILEANLAAAEHVFWPLEHPIPELTGEIRCRVTGHRQLADALLLDLAIRRQGRLATFDGRIEGLLPTDSTHRSALEVLPIT